MIEDCVEFHYSLIVLWSFLDKDQFNRFPFRDFLFSSKCVFISIVQFVITKEHIYTLTIKLSQYAVQLAFTTPILIINIERFNPTIKPTNNDLFSKPICSIFFFRALILRKMRKRGQKSTFSLCFLHALRTWRHLGRMSF